MEPVEARSDFRSKLIPAPVHRVYAAIGSAESIARWWGPAGFRNTIHTFEFEPGGRWLLTMHGPDGRDYPNESRFLRILPEKMVEIEHLSDHHFMLSIEIEAEGANTRVRWRQTFDSVEHYQRIASFVAPANEQNLERLAAEAQRADDAA